MRRLPLLALLLPVALMLGGCPVWGPDDGTRRAPDAPPPVGDTCESDHDCPLGAICDFTDGVCVEGCYSDDDCPLGAICDLDAGMCTEGCYSDDDCPVGRYCDPEIDRCVSDAGGCDTTSDCSGSQVCVEGGCRDQESTCQFNNQCGAGRACVNNACVDLCTSDATCGSGTACIGGLCRPVAECSHGGHCGAGQDCVGGRCLTDCSEGGVCPSSADMCDEDGYCRPDWRPRPFCTTEAQCADGRLCVDGSCRTPCPTGTDLECQSYDHQLQVCGGDNLCYTGNEADPECATQADCADGQSCIDAICR
jgi:hypothetical protein